MTVKQALYDSDGNSDKGGSSNIESGTRASTRGSSYSLYNGENDDLF